MRQYRILVVDDEDAVLDFVDRVIRDAGYDTTIAHRAEEALNITATGQSFDLLLTDLLMPGISGDELARYMRRTDPDLKVLYLTGFADRLLNRTGFIGGLIPREDVPYGPTVEVLPRTP